MKLKHVQNLKGPPLEGPKLSYNKFHFLVSFTITLTDILHIIAIKTLHPLFVVGI